MKISIPGLSGLSIITTKRRVKNPGIKWMKISRQFGKKNWEKKKERFPTNGLSIIRASLPRWPNSKSTFSTPKTWTNWKISRKN